MCTNGEVLLDFSMEGLVWCLNGDVLFNVSMGRFCYVSQWVGHVRCLNG